jgi:hypothetical protein
MSLEEQSNVRQQSSMNRSDSLSLAEGERMGIIRRISIRFGGSKPRELERFLKFLVVGAIGAMIDLGTTNFLMRFVFQVQDGQLLPVVTSAAIGFTLAVCSNFSVESLLDVSRLAVAPRALSAGAILRRERGRFSGARRRGRRFLAHLR